MVIKVISPGKVLKTEVESPVKYKVSEYQKVINELRATREKETVNRQSI